MSNTNFGIRKKELEKTLTLSERQDISFVSSQIGQMVRFSRIKKGYTQKQLAEKMGKKQSSIARLEAGTHPPTIAFLNDIAIALDTYLVEPQFKSTEHSFTGEITNTSKSTVNSGVTFKYAKEPKQTSTSTPFWKDIKFFKVSIK